MKIAIMGYSGSGKSTLAQKMADKYNIAVLHFDTVQFKPNWEIRSDAVKKKMTEEEYAALSAEDKAWMEERCNKLLENMKRLYDIANNIC